EWSGGTSSPPARGQGRVLAALDPWSGARQREASRHGEAGKRAERFLAASSVPVIRVALTTTGASVRLACVANTIPTRRGSERSERTSEDSFPAPRQRDPGGQFRPCTSPAASTRWPGGVRGRSLLELLHLPLGALPHRRRELRVQVLLHVQHLQRLLGQAQRLLVVAGGKVRVRQAVVGV